jgi:peptidylprolyl isomerase
MRRPQQAWLWWRSPTNPTDFDKRYFDVRRIPVRLLAAGTLPVLLLAGCGSSSSNGGGSSSTSKAASTSASASTSAAAAAPYTVPAGKVSQMSDIKLSAQTTKSPKLTFGKKPFQVNKTTVKVLSKGTGAPVTDKQIATVNYAVVVGSNGKTIANTFASTPVSMALNDQTQLPGLVQAVKGQPIGTKELVAIPPSDAFGTQGASSYGVTAKDSLVAYIEVKSAVTPLAQASGKAVAPKAGMPTVKWNGVAKPATITMPNSAAPKKLESANLINGTGATVKKGQTLYALYTGVVWKNGKAGTVFDSTGNRKGQPAGFTIGTGQVIPGWDKTLVGKKVGDRVEIVVPPADGYGTSGNSQAGIKGTDTLVFVVDIVAAS